MADTNDVRVEAKVSVDGVDLRVRRFDLVEELDALPRLELEVLAWEGAPPRPAAVVDRAVQLVIERSDGRGERRFSGTVVAAERSHDEQGRVVLRLEATSTLVALALRRDQRIFQDVTPPDVLEAVIAGAGFDGAIELRLNDTYEPRTYLVQAGETDLDFVRRLAAEEGIWCAVLTDEDGKEHVVLGDAADGLGPTTPDVLPFGEAFGFEATVDRILEVERIERVRSDRIFVRDYDPERPALAVEGDAESADPGPHAAEVYAWPARVSEPAAAKRRARILLEEVQRDRASCRGSTGSVALVPGHVFSLEGHPWEVMNEAWLVLGSRVRGTPPDAAAGDEQDRLVLTSTFEACPTARSACRPPRREPAATFVGTQSAFVTGAPGEEIHVDAAARVKVSYPWDRSGRTDDTSSCWVRTSQLPLGGSMLLPRVGWEVAVRHVDGDPDRPFVFGRLVNGAAPPSYGLPAEKGRSSLQTATSPGGGSVNEVRLGDDAGSELVFMNASKDMTIEVKNNATESIGRNSTKKVGSQQTTEVTDSSTASVGASETIEVGGNQTVHVETLFADEVAGDHTLTVGGSRDLKIGGDHRREVAGSSSSVVGSNRIDLVVGSASTEALGDLTHDVGAAKIDLSVGAQSTTVGGSRTETVGALKVLAALGGRGVEVGGSLMTKVAGAIIDVATADHAEKTGATYTEVAAGAHIVKAANVSLEGESLIAVVMGASTLVVTPAMVMVGGLSVKIDGDLSDLGIVIDN